MTKYQVLVLKCLKVILQILSSFTLLRLADTQDLVTHIDKGLEDCENLGVVKGR